MTEASGHRDGTVLLPAADGTLAWLPHGRVTWVRGRIARVEPLPGDGVPERLLLPGFVDLHCHWVQSHVRGRFAGQLLDWLRGWIWPAEAAFSKPAVAERRAKEFVQEALRAGTCGGLFFGAPFAEASLVFARTAPPGFLEGPALMEVNAPAELLRPVSDSLRVLSVADDVHGRLSVAPRFAPTMTGKGLQVAAAAGRAFKWPAQSHLSENVDETAWVRQLFPDAADYTDVYDRAGLLGPKTVMAHGIHLSDRELARLAATGTWIAHCPTSNEALGSGRMPLERLREHGVAWVLASDVGAGPHLSLLDVVRAYLQVHDGKAETTASEALCRATAIPGTFLAACDADLAGIGTFAVGAPAHIVAFERPAGTGPDAMVRELVRRDRKLLDRAPLEVVHWGEPAFAAPVRS